MTFLSEMDHPLKLENLLARDEETVKVAQRIIERTKIADRGCLEWCRAKDDDGYGVIGYRGQQMRVHRFVYLFWIGPLPKEKPFVLHRCDNPPCCLPVHLFPGDAGINRRDCQAKGRMFIHHGESCYNSKITERQALHILYNYQWRVPGRMASDFARKFNVSVGAVWGVLQGKTWKHLKEITS